MRAYGNIFDPIQTTLDQKVFNGITPRPRVGKFILDEMHKVLTPLVGFDPLPYMTLYLTGSLTTYQYDTVSDCDVSLFIDWDNWPTHEDPNLIRRKLIPIVMDKLDGTTLPGTQHPIQHFIVPPGVEPHELYKPGLRSAWSFTDSKWLVPPEKDRVHDISVELPVMYHRAEDMADKMENLLKFDPIYAKEFWHQIHRKRQMDQRAGLGDFSEGNIVYKYLLHNGYFDRIRDELGEKISKVASSFYYHVSPKENRESILRDGLRPRSVVTGREDEARAFANYYEEVEPKPWDLWIVDITGLDKVPDPDYTRGGIPDTWEISDGVPPDRLRLEKAAKIATGLPGENYIPAIGSIWVMSDPWATVKRTKPRKSIQVIDADDDYIWYKNLDTQAEQIMRVDRWNDLMYRQIIFQRDQDWQLQETPEEGAEQWPDTLPENWSMVREAETQRLFLAYELPEQIVAQVLQWQKQNAPEGVHPEPPTNLHMTIAFLGDTETSLIPGLQQVLTEIDPSQVLLSGPIEYQEQDKLAFLVLQDQGGNEVVEQINEKLNQLMGYEPRFRPWLPHITVWRFAPENKPNLQPQLPNFGSFTPLGVHVYTSVKNPAGGGTYQKVADDLSWVDKSTPYGTPPGGFIGGPEHPGDDSIDLPSEPGRDQPPIKNDQVRDTPGSLKVIFDFENDQIILGDVRKAQQFPPGQIIGDYREPDVYLNDHAEAWFNPGYFKRLWQHSFPKRQIRHVILDKGGGQHEVVHHHQESATLENHGKQEARTSEAKEEQVVTEESSLSSESSLAANRKTSQDVEEYDWPSLQDVKDVSEATVVPHQGYRDEGLIEGAIGNTQMMHHYGQFNDIFDLVAHLVAKLQRQQAIVEGNKRTAIMTGIQFLENHGYDARPLLNEPLEDEMIRLIYNFSDSEADESTIPALAEFLREHVKPAKPDYPEEWD
jgi:2'-5' RNA ligase